MARILVIDDSPDERLIYSAVLLHYGHEVEQAAEASRGLELARSNKPDLILLDVHLPVMNGLMLAELMRSIPETEHIPIVCLSGHDISPSHAISCGCTRFMRKPIAPRQLMDLVSALLPPAPPELAP